MSARISILVLALGLALASSTPAPGQGVVQRQQIRRWIDALDRGGPGARVLAAHALRKIGPPASAAIPALARRLGDREQGVGEAAAAALARIGPRAVPALLAALGHKDGSEVKLNAERALGAMGAGAGVALNKLILGKTSRRMRLLAIKTLGEASPKLARSLSTLVRILKDPDPQIRRAAALGLRAMALHSGGADEKDSHPESSVPVVKALLEALKDADPAVRAAADDALRNLDQPYFRPLVGAVPVLMRALRDSDPNVRQFAVSFMASIQRPLTKRSLSVLEATLADKDPVVRAAAARSLGKIGSPAANRAIPALAGRLADGSTAVRRQAIKAILTLFSEIKIEVEDNPLVYAGRIMPALIRALRDRHKEVRATAAAAMSHVERLPGRAIGALKARLSDKEPEVRRAAVEALARAGRRAIPSAVRAMHDSDPGVRKQAANALARIGRPALPHLLRALRSKRAPTRAVAAAALGGLSRRVAAAAVPALVKASEDPDKTIRRAACRSLGQIRGSSKALVALENRLTDRDTEVREIAAVAIGWFGPDAVSAVPELALALKDGHSSVRWKAAEALRGIGPKAAQVIPDLVIAMRDSSSAVRWGAAEALAFMGRAGGKALARALTDWSPQAAASAAFALAEMGPRAKPALHALIHALKGKRSNRRLFRVMGHSRMGSAAAQALLAEAHEAGVQIRKGSATALGKLGPAAAPAVGALRRALKDSTPSVRAAAATALGQIGRPAAAAVSDLLRLLKTEGNQDVLHSIIRTLGEIGPRAARALPVLRRLLVKGDYPIQEAAARAACQVRPDATGIAIAIGALTSTVVDVRVAAASCLARLKATRAIPALARALDLRDGYALERVMNALKQLRPASIPTLRAALTHKDPHVRATAAAALGDLRVKAAVPALVERLVQDPDRHVRSGAATALGKMAGQKAIPALIQSLADRRSLVRWNVVESVVKLACAHRAAQDKVEAALVPMLNDRSSIVRETVADGLGKLGRKTPAVVKALRRRLRDRDSGVRIGAARALGHLGRSKLARRVLKRELRRCTNCRIEVAKALADLGLLKLALVQLEQALMSNHQSVRYSAAEAIAALGSRGKPLVPALERALLDRNKSVRLLVRRALDRVRR